MLYRLKPDHMLSDTWFLDEPLSSGTQLDARAFTGAKVHEGPLAGIRFPVGRTGKPVSFNFGAFDIPVVDRAIYSALKDIVADDVQWIPSRVDGTDSTFYIMNVIRTPSCIDEARTEGHKWPATGSRPEKAGQYRGIVRLVLDERRAGPFKVFRVGGWKIALVVNDEVANALRRVPNHGLEFESVS